MNEAEFKSPLGASEELLFYRMQAREELGRLPEFRLDLMRNSRLKPLQAKQLLGKTASVIITPHKGDKRHLHGHITQFERGGVNGGYDLYRVVLRPWLWQLSLKADHRIFQDKTVVQILDAIFAEYDSAGPVEKKFKGSFTARPYTVQYRESDFNFVSRLMEEEGIYYYFKHEAGNHKLVLCKGPSGHEPIPVGKLVWGASVEGNEYREDLMLDWTQAHLLQSLKFSTTDYAAEAPTADLLRNATRQTPYPKPNDLEVFHYPGQHDDYAMGTNLSSKQKAGEDRAQLEVDRFESLHSVSTGLTHYRLLSVGKTFNLADHPDEGGYLVTSSITEMQYSGYEGGQDAGDSANNYVCRFNAVPKAVAFQPEAVTPVPVVNGPQTALVVGPKGDEIHTDKYGRIKVQFHWDRVAKKESLNEKSSCWLRLSHPWASKGFGMVALPRIGDEVVVTFLEGNPDRPLITGSVYNGTNDHPWPLPKHASMSGVRTRSTKKGANTNFNELRFEDEKDGEYVWFQAEKDFHHWVKNDSFHTVKNDLWTDTTKNVQHQIGENLTMSVGKVATLDIKEDTHLTLGADLNTAVTGALSLKVTGKVDAKSDQAVALTAGVGMDVNAGTALNITAGTTLHLKATTGVVIDGGMQLCIKAGAGFIVLGPEGVSIVGPMVKINSGGSAGAATAAAKAAPVVPKEPGVLKENKDPDNLSGGAAK